MRSIARCSIPQGAFLQTYAGGTGYADCYTTQVPFCVSQSRYIEAFYTTAIFKLERLILKYAVGKPSTDADARALAAGTSDHFAAWHTERRDETQLLLCDYAGRTRSWLMAAAVSRDSVPSTQLYFGSAVVPARKPADGSMEMPRGFRALLGFHQLYSVILLRAAKSRLSDLEA